MYWSYPILRVGVFFLFLAGLKWSYVLGSVLSIEQRRFFAECLMKKYCDSTMNVSYQNHMFTSVWRHVFFSVVWLCNGCLDTRSHNLFPYGSIECRLWKGPIHSIYVPYISVIVHNLYRLKILHSFVEHQVLLYTSPWILFSTIVFLTEPEENQISPTCDKTRPIIAGMLTICHSVQISGVWLLFFRDSARIHRGRLD